MVASFTESQLQLLSEILAEAVTGPEMSRVFARLAITDVSSTASKKNRVYDALALRQKSDGHATKVADFLQACMDPVRFSGNGDSFESLRSRLNGVLAFAGIRLGEDGLLRPTDIAKTLTDAEDREARTLIAKVAPTFR